LTFTCQFTEPLRRDAAQRAQGNTQVHGVLGEDLPVDSHGHQQVGDDYDSVADDYLANFAGELDDKPLDRALLASVMEGIGRGETIADVGCGPGHVANWLAAQDGTVVGIDLSARMIDLGRQNYPGVEFRQGDMLSLPAADEEFAAVIALYSVIHLRPHELPSALAEMRRVLRPNGALLISFHVGTEVRHVDEWWGKAVDLDFRFLDPDDVITHMSAAGLITEARIERLSYRGEVETRRGYLIARRPPGDH
jgi:ubiquinone/menaquinone biosynthesis C-methylase UbiE